MTREQFETRRQAIMDTYNIVGAPKVCNERVDYLVDTLNLYIDYVSCLEEKLQKIETK